MLFRSAALVILSGTEEQKLTWLPQLLEEPILCSFGLSEPDAGSDVARMKTTAVRRGDEYVLNGSKTFITNAGHASWTVVFAKTDAAAGNRGMSAFIVPMDTPGVELEKHLDKMGQRSTDTSAFALTDVVVPAANRIGDADEDRGQQQRRQEVGDPDRLEIQEAQSDPEQDDAAGRADGQDGGGVHRIADEERSGRDPSLHDLSQ